MINELSTNGNYDYNANSAFVNYNDIMNQTRKATLFMINHEEKWLPNDYIFIDEENNKIYLPSWLYDKNFI